MSKNQTISSRAMSLLNKGLGYLKVFRFKNNRLNKIAYFGLAGLFVFILCFQNCKEVNLTTTNQVGQSDPETSPTPSPDHTDVTIPPAEHFGSILAYLANDTEKISKDEFTVGQAAGLDFVSFKEGSDSFKWTIQRGFQTIVNAAETTQPTYTASPFNQKGSHDVFATSHRQGDSQVLSFASKKLIVGQECDPADILEIKLSSGSLVKGQSVTFTLEDASTFTNINWKAGTKEQANQSEMTLDLDANANTITVEVTAVDADPNKSECLIYRKQEFPVSDITKPSFDFVRPVDDVHPVILENNYIYKYKRTSQSKFIEVHITDAKDCHYGNNPISCNRGKENINQRYLDTSQCDQGVDVVKASYFDSNNNLQTETRSFYHFCPIDKDFCYFAPVELRPNHHYCRGRSPATPSTTPSVCSPGQLSQGYKAVNGQCLPSCSIAGGTHTGTDCDPSDAYDHVLFRSTHEDPCCTRTPKSPVDGQCDNTVRNSCAAGTVEVQAPSGGFDRWNCKGINNGKDASPPCQILQPTSKTDGVCNNDVINGCASGDFENPRDDGRSNIWDCKGRHGGSHADNCQRPFIANGVCGTTTEFECSSGTPVNQETHSTYHQWGCDGISGGTSTAPDACRKDRVFNGVCDNSKKDGCSPGNPINTGTDATDTKYVWHCQGINGGTPATDCEMFIPVHAQCGNTKDTCSPGNFKLHSGITTQAGVYTWECEGLHDGDTARGCTEDTSSKCRYPDTIEGYINTCEDNIVAQPIEDNNPNYYRWSCGNETCQRLRIDVHGECGVDSYNNKCKAGVPGDVSTHIEDYATTGYYILPELPGDATQKSGELNEDTNGAYALSTLDKIWSCAGGRSTVYCREAQSFAGECPSTPPPYNAKNDFINYCRSGYVTRKSDNLSAYTWWCYGNGKFNSNHQECTRQKSSEPIPPPASDIKSQGECSNQQNQCRGGVLENRKTKQLQINYTSGNSATIRTRNVNISTWECAGSVPSSTGPVATNKKCKQSSSLFNGKCGNDINQCAGGFHYPLNDTDTHYRWLCFGQNRGASVNHNDPRQRIGGHIVYCSLPKFTIDSNGNIHPNRAQ